MTLAGLALYVSVYLAAVAAPGPGIALVLARSMGKGLDRVGWFAAGFALGDNVLFALAASGLAVVAQTFEGVFVVIRLAGVGYLLFLAWKIWHAPVAELAVTPTSVRESRFQALMSSFLLTMGNPKPIMFFLAIMPLVVDLASLSLETFAILALVNICVIVPVMLGYALLANRARGLFRSPRAMRTANRTTAGIMAGTAIVMATR